MTVLVTYMSVTGNTKKVADAIYGEIGGKKEIKPMDEVKSLDGYELSFIGFPIHSGGVPTKVKEFLEKHAKGKKMAIFFTHAAFADPKIMPGSDVLIKNEQQKAREAAAGAILLGSFDCRGVLGDDVAKRCLSSPDPVIQQFGKAHPLTLGHPDATELSQARAFAREMMTKK